MGVNLKRNTHTHTHTQTLPEWREHSICRELCSWHRCTHLSKFTSWDPQDFGISVYVNLTSMKRNEKGASNSFNWSSSRDWKKGVSGAELEEAGTQGSDVPGPGGRQRCGLGLCCVFRGTLSASCSLAAQLWRLTQPSSSHVGFAISPSSLRHFGGFVPRERLTWSHSSLWVSLPPVLGWPGPGGRLPLSPCLPEPWWTAASEKSHLQCLLPAQPRSWFLAGSAQAGDDSVRGRATGAAAAGGEKGPHPCGAWGFCSPSVRCPGRIKEQKGLELRGQTKLGWRHHPA